MKNSPQPVADTAQEGSPQVPAPMIGASPTRPLSHDWLAAPEPRPGRAIVAPFRAQRVPWWANRLTGDAGIQ
jgi:hypothetical protein